MILSEMNKSAIKAHAWKEAPNESCGYICHDKNRGIIKTIKGENVSDTPKTHFLIDGSSYLKALTSGGKVIGFYHSQKEKEPSELDKKTAKIHDLASVIYSLDYDCFDTIYPTDYCLPYEGREFEFGKGDCFSLVRDFYKNEFNIVINDYERSLSWLNKNSNIFESKYKTEGFKVVKAPKHGDIIMLSYYGDKTTHLGIYMERNLILHHPRGRLSIIESIKSPTEKKIKKFIRHETLFN
tara:strand:- start:10549 stop:11265 length:717 start_codon:yes stop_codon:yes gene_type:complete